MKIRHALFFVLSLLINFALVGVVISLVLKEQEQAQTIQELQTQKRLEGQKASQSQQEGELQKQSEEQARLEAQKQLAAGRIRTIDDNLDKIDARLQRVLDEPLGYADETKPQRDTQEELLHQLANCARAEIRVLVVEMQNAGFAGAAALEQNLDAFFGSYETKIHDEHVSYDFADLGFKDSTRKQELDAEAMQSLQAAYAAKRAIHNLKPVQQ